MLRIDVVSRTILAALLSAVLLYAEQPAVIATVGTIAFAAALIALASRPLLLITLAAPALPIGLSHFVIEPALAGANTDTSDLFEAGLAFIRVSGLTAVTVSWLNAMTLTDAASLSRMMGLGQWLVAPFAIISSTISVAQGRWRTIREIRAFRTPGKTRDKRATPLTTVAPLGLQLALATLHSAIDLELSCRGRSILTKRELAAPLARITFAGATLVLVALVSILWYIKVNP